MYSFQTKSSCGILIGSAFCYE